ncbi:helix-turn-helix transcriptional regulator [Klebsiella sp. BIGb0407]|uniref:helix-turn-helix domain-containing protein n=1 Tax=Klebsiella sp. BIGb0407 TaxID=2940603 RepID=UPI002168B811|nr:helix-turn-helix transcriptional regulator [Klebsiella sp. BIGb0407]MCS3434041.1 Ner family transcriptional regulator [Klebsiella sp. BIGb0407]
MSNSAASQKRPRKGSSSDWHRADIVAALHKKGVTLAQLSREHGLSSRTLNNALERAYPRAEQIIAAVIGTVPEKIWPSRYVNKLSSGSTNDE